MNGGWFRRSAAGDAGSGSVLGIAVCGCVIAMLAVAIPLEGALVARQRATGAADAAALAAADTASGLVAGAPCDNAARAAQLGRSHVDSCSVDAGEALVVVSGSYLGIAFQVRSRAGPPRDGG